MLPKGLTEDTLALRRAGTAGRRGTAVRQRRLGRHRCLAGDRAPLPRAPRRRRAGRCAPPGTAAGGRRTPTVRLTWRRQHPTAPPRLPSSAPPRPAPATHPRGPTHSTARPPGNPTAPRQPTRSGSHPTRQPGSTRQSGPARRRPPSRQVIRGPAPGTRSDLADWILVSRPLVLASASPARLGLLRAAGLDPSRRGQRHRRGPRRSLPRASWSSELAVRKAPGRGAAPEGALVVGCDSLLELDGRAHGKPGTAEVALERWRRHARPLRHAAHRPLRRSTPPPAGRRPASAPPSCASAPRADEELAAYVASGEPLHVAGGVHPRRPLGAVRRRHRRRPGQRHRPVAAAAARCCSPSSASPSTSCGPGVRDLPRGRRVRRPAAGRPARRRPAGRARADGGGDRRGVPPAVPLVRRRAVRQRDGLGAGAGRAGRQQRPPHLAAARTRRSAASSSTASTRRRWPRRCGCSSTRRACTTSTSTWAARRRR